jgi:uncharacterized protein YndB with AHSA1/START domain
MPITNVASDPETLSLTITGEYPVSVDRLWRAWHDPRQLEKFWGPPSWPATFTRHDMVAGGRSEYFMTGPNGERSAGYWIFEEVDEGRRFTIVDGFANDDGTPNDELPGTRTEFRFEATDAGSRYTATTRFSDLESMEKLLEMGMVEGATLAAGQIDSVLADLASFAAGQGVETTLIGETHAMFRRVIRGRVEKVWEAHNEPELLQRWLLGPDGWTMPVCEVAREIGETYRYEWVSDDGENRFGFEGELLESVPPLRSVTTEKLIDTDGPSTTNEMTLTPLPDGTLLSILVTYPSEDLRSQILSTGMTGGMEASYERLDTLLGAPVNP